jgi:hypothetical protein
LRGGGEVGPGVECTDEDLDGVEPNQGVRGLVEQWVRVAHLAEHEVGEERDCGGIEDDRDAMQSVDVLEACTIDEGDGALGAAGPTGAVAPGIGYQDIRPDDEDNSGDDDREDADAQQSIVILISPEGTVGADERVGGEQCEQHERRGEMDRDDFCGQLALNRDLAELVLDGE